MTTQTSWPELVAITTDSTCGAACWMALEDVCRCSCGGRNHGVLRSGAATQPTRTRKLDGHVYELLAVEAPNGTCRAETTQPIRDLENRIDRAAVNAGAWHYYDFSTPGCPVKVKTASESEVARWPELASWRKGGGGWYPWRPIVAWIRADLKHLAE